MSDTGRWRSPGATALALVLMSASAVSCVVRQPPPAIEPPPLAVPAQLAAPTSSPAAGTPVASAPLSPSDTASEVHIDIDTHGAEVDVRTLLDFIARSGGFTLVYSPNINRRVRLQLTNVPVSVALQTVLSLANLTLESATPTTKAPGSTSVVFYQLPVNVDSLSVDAIMKRFGVGRNIAEMIVEARTMKP